MTLRRLVIMVVVAPVFALALGAAAVAAAQQPRPQQQEEFVPLSELPPEEQLPAQPLLVAAYAFAWLAIGGYVFSVSRRLDTVKREIERLEADSKRGR